MNNTIPITLEEAHQQLLTKLSVEDLNFIDNSIQEAMSSFHFSLGRWIRNNWKLWEGGELKTHMESLGFTHPDDMSAVILDTFWCSRHSNPFNLEQRAKYYADFWAESDGHKYGVNYTNDECGA